MKKSILILSGLAAFGLSACESTKQQFDFSKKAPDEFAIITRAPLEIPASLDNDITLPPPRIGTARPQETAPALQAKQTLFGDNQTTADGLTEGESLLLQKTGATDIAADIRATIDAETEQEIKKNTPTFDRLLGKVGRDYTAPADIIDPVKERERILQTTTATIEAE